MSEREEAFMRILVAIVSGIVIYLWLILVKVLTIFNLLYTIYSNKRSKRIAKFCNIWNTQAYIFVRYITFSTNSRPFPFEDLSKVLHPVEMKKKK